MKKTVLLLSAAVLLALVTGCGSEKEKSAETNEEKSGETFVLGSEPLEISMFGNYDWYTMPKWGGDEATAAIKETFQVDITAIDGGGNAAQRLSTMIAGDSLPDFIWLDRSADVERLRTAGVLVPFDDYLDKYTNLRDWAGEEIINMLRSEDGKL